MCLHSVLNPSPVERVKKCRFSNTNENQNCTKIALGKNTILLFFGYSTLTFMSKRAPSVAPPRQFPLDKRGWLSRYDLLSRSVRSAEQIGQIRAAR